MTTEYSIFSLRTQHKPEKRRPLSPIDVLYSCCLHDSRSPRTRQDGTVPPAKKHELGGNIVVTFLQNAVGFLWGTPLIVLVLGSGALFTIGTGFFQFRHCGPFMARTFGSRFK